MLLYEEVFGRELEWLYNVERAKRPARVPGLLTEAEVRAILAQMDGRLASRRGSFTLGWYTSTVMLRRFKVLLEWGSDDHVWVAYVPAVADISTCEGRAPRPAGRPRGDR